MYYLSILILSFLATLSLASPVARRGVCPSNGSGNVNNNSRLLSVSKDDSSVQSSLAIGSNSYPTPNSETWLGVSTLFFFFFQFLSFARELMSHIWNAGNRLSLRVVVAKDFAMRDSGITAYSSGGGVVGVSDNVAENGLLPFIYPFEDVFVDAEIYCELVSW